jgi:hypothetical protein
MVFVLPALLVTILAMAAVFAWLIFKPPPIRKRSSLELLGDSPSETPRAGPVNPPRLGAAPTRGGVRRGP